jgi:hypothetical protein
MLASEFQPGPGLTKRGVCYQFLALTGYLYLGSAPVLYTNHIVIHSGM